MNSQELLAQIPRTTNSTRWPGVRILVNSYYSFRVVLGYDGHTAEVRGLKGTDARRDFAFLDTLTGNTTLAEYSRKRLPERVQNGLVAALRAFHADPVKFVDEHGKQNRCCCFCATPLTFHLSRERGYGPDCAARYGLPYDN